MTDPNYIIAGILREHEFEQLLSLEQHELNLDLARAVWNEAIDAAAREADRVRQQPTSDALTAHNIEGCIRGLMIGEKQ